MTGGPQDDGTPPRDGRPPHDGRDIRPPGASPWSWRPSRPAPPSAAPPAPPSAEVPPPRRVAVAAPRRNRSGGWSARAAAEDLHAQPRLGQIYVRALVRDQLRLALAVLAGLAVVLGGLPAAFALLPGLRTAEVAGIRLPWLLFGAVAYPVMVGAAWFHVRHAERVEHDFAELLRAPAEDPAAATRDDPEGSGGDGDPAGPPDGPRGRG